MSDTTDRLAQAIYGYWGWRCATFDGKCSCCLAWAEYDRLGALAQKLEAAEKERDEMMRIHVSGRANISQLGTGDLTICFGEHDKNEPCKWEHFVADRDFTEPRQALYLAHEAIAELADALDDGLCNSETPGFDSMRLERAKIAALALTIK